MGDISDISDMKIKVLSSESWHPAAPMAYNVYKAYKAYNVGGAESQTIWEYSSSCLAKYCKVLQSVAKYCKVFLLLSDKSASHLFLQQLVGCNPLQPRWCLKQNVATLLSDNICCNALLTARYYKAAVCKKSQNLLQHHVNFKILQHSCLQQYVAILPSVKICCNDMPYACNILQRGCRVPDVRFCKAGIIWALLGTPGH